jgi:hypothetical protein
MGALMTFGSAARHRLSLLAWAGCVALAAPACANLGGPYASVEADRAHFGASLQSTATATHTVHALTLANRGMIKEFSRADGTVFAVTWRGAGRPDLRQLLGEHFQTLQADNVRTGRRTRQPLSVNRSDLVIMTGGHPGGFWGVAFLPQQAPAGFSTGELKN